MSIHNPGDGLICVDVGTTNTRVWLVAGEKILARKTAAVGARDSARTGTKKLLREALRSLIEGLRVEAQDLGFEPRLVVGAGMITSSLGLKELPHIAAPAGEQELARAVRECPDPEVCDLPIWLVPGVRSGPASPVVDDLAEIDLIRGEETICVGLVKLGLLNPHSTLLNLGSHWKAILLDELGRICTSYTTLSGEVIHAIQKETVLSSCLPPGRLQELDSDWLAKGIRDQERYGVSRVLFCARILEQVFSLGPIQISSFVVGALVGADLKGMLEAGKLGQVVLISGTGAVAEAWRQTLKSVGRKALICDPETIERAFVTGLLCLANLAFQR